MNKHRFVIYLLIVGRLETILFQLPHWHGKIHPDCQCQHMKIDHAGWQPGYMVALEICAMVVGKVQSHECLICLWGEKAPEGGTQGLPFYSCNRFTGPYWRDRDHSSPWVRYILWDIRKRRLASDLPIPGARIQNWATYDRRDSGIAPR